MARGFTLLEVVISMALALLVLGLGVAFLIPATRASVKGATRIDLEQRAVSTLARIVEDLTQSVPAGISIRYGDPQVLAVNPVDRLQADGTLVWSSTYVIYAYASAEARVTRRTWPPDPPVPAGPPDYQSPLHAKRLSGDLMAAIATTPSSTTAVLTRDVQAFTIDPPGSDTELRQPLKLTLRLARRQATGSQSPEVFEFSRTVFLPGDRS